MEKKKPLLSIRPHFDPKLALIESLPATLVATFAAVAAGGTFFYILFSVTGLIRFISADAIYLSFLLLGLALTPAFYYEIKQRAFARTAYHFYDSYMEYQNFRFFISRRRGRVRYDDIADVTQHPAVLQGLCGLTTVYIYVPGMGYQARGPFAGVRMGDIPEQENAGVRILDIIESRAAVLQGSVPPPMVEAISASVAS